jgi:hypothetical protein
MGRPFRKDEQNGSYCEREICEFNIWMIFLTTCHGERTIKHIERVDRRRFQ